MTFVVPFDGSDEAAAALTRAAALAGAQNEPVVVVSVVPRHDPEFAARAGLAPDEPTDPETVTERLRDRVVAIAPGARFESIVVQRRAPPGTIAGRIRRLARDLGATTVAIGSDEAGRSTHSLGSIGARIASDGAYDVLIVRSSVPLDA